MPGDLIISDASLHAAPKETPVPASTRYIVKQVQALYTDNGAGGAWLPALEIVSDAGIVTGRYVGTSVTAGNGQEVTWFPLGSKGGAPAPPSVPSLASAFISQFIAGIAGSPARVVGTDYSGDFTKNSADYTLEDGNTSLGLGLAGQYQLTSFVTLFDTQAQRLYNRECEVQVKDAAAVWGPFGGGDLVDYGSMPPGYIAGQNSLTAVQSAIEAPYNAIANPQIVNVDPAAWNGLPVHVRPAANFAGPLTNPISLVIALHALRLGDMLV